MAEPFLAEIRIVSFNFPPNGWALCDGQLLPINQNQALFSLLGTTYGGNGQTTFALPDLRGRAPMHFGSGHTLGEESGEENHTLVLSELPQHVHVMNASKNNATSALPENDVPAGAQRPVYKAPDPAAVQTVASSAVGGSQAHSNMQPFLTLQFVIALQGIFPSQN